MPRLSHYPLRRLTAIYLPLSGALTILALAAQPAFAGDRKTYPGNACQPFNQTTANDLEMDGSGLKNLSTSNVRVVYCPIVRDNTTNSDGTDDIEVFGYNDRSLTFSCNFVATSAATGTAVASSAQSVSVPGDFKLVIPGVKKSSSGGYYYLGCSIPPSSKIYGYIVPEH
jgi:hypothetical protein